MLKVISTLGEGGYGRVCKVSYKGKEMALKIFECASGLDCPWELEILSKKIPGIMYSEEKINYNGSLGILMPLAKCDLRTLLYKNPENISFIITSICNSLANMHAHGYYHLDLKPENVLIFSSEILLADFSISRPSSMKVCNQKFATPNFRPPELFFPPKDFPLTDKIDSWSLGILILEILSGFYLSGTEESICRKISDIFSDKNRKKTLSFVPKEYFSLVDGLLQYDYKKRISIREYMGKDLLKNKVKVRFFTHDDLAPYYGKMVDIIRKSQGSWMTCINAITIINEYYEIKKKISLSVVLCAIKLSYQLQEDILFDYKFFSLFLSREERLHVIELDIILTLPLLVPKILKTPYPHLTLEQLSEKI